MEEQYVKLRKSVKVIARENGIKSHNSVSQFLDKFGIERSSNRLCHADIPYEYLYEEYVVKKRGLRQIAQELGTTSRSQLRLRLRELGIESHKGLPINDAVVEGWKKQRTHPNIPGRYWSRTVRSAETRGRKFEISMEYAWSLFVKQKGLCALSGKPIRFHDIGEPGRNQTASLDRIDSSKDYIEGNVQWVHKKLNKMKCSMSDDEFIEACREVADYSRQQ